MYRPGITSTNVFLASAFRFCNSIAIEVREMNIIFAKDISKMIISLRFYFGRCNSLEQCTNLLNRGKHEAVLKIVLYDVRKPGVKKSWEFLIPFARSSSR